MGKNSDTCQQITIPGIIPAAPMVPVAPNNIFENLEANQPIKIDELVVPFHAWGSFFDVQPGQSVKIEGPEEAGKDYQVVPKYIKGADMSGLEICTI